MDALRARKTVDNLACPADGGDSTDALSQREANEQPLSLLASS